MKKNILKFRLFLLSLIKHPREFLIFYKHIRCEEILDNYSHIKLAADWLLRSQEVGNDLGYSRGFYLYKKGWDQSYIETTGYIIQTMLNLYNLTKDERYKKSALDAGEWLLDIQKNNGAYCDIDKGNELVFDTGQVLYGLIEIYQLDDLSEALKNRYENSIYKASKWLCDVQDTDGSWTKYGFNAIAHSYYSRVSSILYKAGYILNNEYFKTCAKKNIDWVLSCQEDNGFFLNVKFSDDEEALLHTLVYVMEGLYDYYILSEDEKVLTALLRNVKKFKEINCGRELLLCSQYDEKFNCINNERCITGLAQWSTICLKLYALTNESEYLLLARKTLYYLKSKQFKYNSDLKGSLPGSVPFWGVYAPYSAINWGVKFFIDALIENEKYKLSLIDDSNLWIGECFKFESHVVDDTLTPTSQEYIKVLKNYISKSENILDLGCGEGKYIRFFKKIFKEKTINGIDPYFYDNKNVKKGDVYNINFDKTFDLIYTIEVLQHVKYLDKALQEVYKNLSLNGIFIICDRNPNSFLGYIKSIQEFRGKWMYPYDSPFIEKWYKNNEWIKILDRNGFELLKFQTFRSPSNWMSKYNIIIARKK